MNAILGVPGSLWSFDAKKVRSKQGEELTRGLVYPCPPLTLPCTWGPGE